MHFPNVPIIGQTTHRVPAQLRLNATENVGKVLESQKALGLKFGRVVIPSGIQDASAELLLALEAFTDAGCTILAVNEHVVNDNQGRQVMLTAVCFRCPDSLFAPKLDA